MRKQGTIAKHQFWKWNPGQGHEALERDAELQRAALIRMLRENLVHAERVEQAWREAGLSGEACDAAEIQRALDKAASRPSGPSS